LISIFAKLRLHKQLILLDQDRVNHALEIPELAQQEYHRLDPRTRLLCDAFAAGLNYYLKSHADAEVHALSGVVPSQAQFEGNK